MSNSVKEEPKKQIWMRAYQGRTDHAWVRQVDGSTLVFKALCDPTKVYAYEGRGMNRKRCGKCERLIHR